jgi:hypothetical protein
MNEVGTFFVFKFAPPLVALSVCSSFFSCLCGRSYPSTRRHQHHGNVAHVALPHRLHRHPVSVFSCITVSPLPLSVGRHTYSRSIKPNLNFEYETSLIIARSDASECPSSSQSHGITGHIEFLRSSTFGALDDYRMSLTSMVE